MCGFNVVNNYIYKWLRQPVNVYSIYIVLSYMFRGYSKKVQQSAQKDNNLHLTLTNHFLPISSNFNSK